MEAIKETVKNVIGAWETQKKQSPKASPAVLLKKIFSKKELGHIKFNYFKAGTLSINIDSSAWLYELSLKKRDLLAKLRKESGSIKDIRFYLGEIR
jgi:predicted nucleic acid-binding Zn ribbon protein